MLPSLIDSPEEPSTTPAEGAGFFIRAVARILDLLVHLLVSTVTGVVAGLVIVFAEIAVHADAQAALARLTTTPASGYLAALLGGAWLHVVSEGLHGSTLGKRVCGLTVVAEDGTAPPGL